MSDQEWSMFSADDLDAPIVERPMLCVPAPAPMELVSKLEQQYRARGIAPTVFTAIDEETGVEIFENAEAYRVAIGLPEGELPTLEQAEAWALDPDRGWAKHEW